MVFLFSRYVMILVSAEDWLINNNNNNNNNGQIWTSHAMTVEATTRTTAAAPPQRRPTPALAHSSTSLARGASTPLGRLNQHSRGSTHSETWAG